MFHDLAGAVGAGTVVDNGTGNGVVDTVDNGEAARALFGVAALLEAQGANPYRVLAYRRAAVGLLRLPHGAAQYLDAKGELVLPWLGTRLRRKLGELVRQGRMQFYVDLVEALPLPFRELLAVPGIGPRTAARLMSEAGVFGLEALERAAREGRLQRLRGIGARREQTWLRAAEQLQQHARIAA
jgi:DNA polymerase/3'-5' exonuclease PolX